MSKSLIAKLLEAAPLGEGFRGTAKDNFEPTEGPPLPGQRGYREPARSNAVTNARTFTVVVSLNPGESADGGEKRPNVTFSEPVKVATMTIDHIGTTDSRLIFLDEIEAAINEICRRHDAACEVSR